MSTAIFIFVTKR